MNEPQREHFKAILLNWKAELMQEVDRTVNHMKDEAANFPDPADRATQEEEFSLELRTRDRERKLIKKIDEATTRLDEHEYGYCEACGVEIGIRRLEAVPEGVRRRCRIDHAARDGGPGKPRNVLHLTPPDRRVRKYRGRLALTV